MYQQHALLKSRSGTTTRYVSLTQQGVEQVPETCPPYI